jgi:hypothetical protein
MRDDCEFERLIFSSQLQLLNLPVPVDNHVILERDAERARGFVDRLRHLDVRARRARIARQSKRRSYAFDYELISARKASSIFSSSSSTALAAFIASRWSPYVGSTPANLCIDAVSAHHLMWPLTVERSKLPRTWPDMR